jgi:hypothetical protein
MPTVKYKGGEKTFPYNACGKAQAASFAAMMNGTMKNNPNYKMEMKTKSGYS